MTSEHLGMVRQIKNLILVKTDRHEDKKLAVRQMEHLICVAVGLYHFMLFFDFLEVCGLDHGRRKYRKYDFLFIGLYVCLKRKV